MFAAKPVPNTKEETYKVIIEDATYLLSKQDTVITTLSNVSALLNYYMQDINWVGFYLYDGEKLTLGPFQGLPACTLIHIGSGVCGKAAKEKVTVIVDDVHAFDGHIACDSNSESEIVVPIMINNTLYGVLDIDSPIKSRFDNVDKKHLEILINKLIDIIE